MSGEASTSTRILFVDDSKVMLKTASKILSAEFDVLTAVDGDDAWDKLGKHHDIQVLFTDINMPGLDGYGLLKNVRTSDDPGLNAIPVIMITGADDDDAARQVAIERGATDFLNKKYLGSELLPRARAHAKYQRISRQLQEQTTLDAATGLANEHGFVDRLEQDVALARRHNSDLALMRVEIDGLPMLYERLGNEAIEPIVTHVAQLIRGRIRKEDTAGRIGLGSFAISAPGGLVQGMEAMARWLRAEAAATAVDVAGHRLAIRLSTAVVGNQAESWASALDALASGQDAIDRAHRAAEEQAAREAARQAAEAQAEEQAAREHARRLAEEQAAREQARRQAEERIAREEARRIAEEQAARETARRITEERAAREQARHQAEEQAEREQARRQAEEQARRDEARRQADEQARRDEARRQAEEAAAREDARRRFEEQAAREDAIRRVEEQAARERAGRKPEPSPNSPVAELRRRSESARSARAASGPSLPWRILAALGRPFTWFAGLFKPRNRK